MPPDPLEGQKHSPYRFAACKTFLGQTLLSRDKNPATTLTTVKTRKDDLTSDPAWVIALFGHNIFMYFHVRKQEHKSPGFNSLCTGQRHNFYLFHFLLLRV